MSARAPNSILRLWGDIHAAIPRAQLGGIVGDVAHSFGYHLSRNDLGSGDYSVQLGRDQRGASDCASALDVTLPPDLMLTCTSRLLTAAKAGDSRLHGLREFCGTTNGSNTHPYDLSNGQDGPLDSWDSSHLWHIHLSFYRDVADNYAALAPIAHVLAGATLNPDQEEEMALSAAAKAEINQIVANQFARYFVGADGHQHQLETLVREALADVVSEVRAIKAKVGA